MAESYSLFDDGVLGTLASDQHQPAERPGDRGGRREASLDEGPESQLDAPSSGTDGRGRDGDEGGGLGDDDEEEDDDGASASSSDSGQTSQSNVSYIRGVRAKPPTKNRRRNQAPREIAAIPEDEEESVASSIQQRRASRPRARSSGSLVEVGLPEQRREGSAGGEGGAAAGGGRVASVDLMLMLNEAVSGWEAMSTTKSSPNASVAAKDEGGDEGGGRERTGEGGSVLGRMMLEEGGNDQAQPSTPQARQKSGEMAAEGGVSLPSYHFGSAVKAKSAAMVQSSRPAGAGASGQRGAGFPYWRRGRSSAAAAEASAAQYSEGHGEPSSGSRFEIVEGLQSRKDEVRTERTASDDDEEGGNGNHLSSLTAANHTSNPTGWITKDTYSFLYIYQCPSPPFLYALCLFAFQFLVYFLLLGSLIDADNPGNVLHVPPAATTTMRIAQGCAIVIAVVNGVDVMVAMHNLLRPPEAIVTMDGYGATGAPAGRRFPVGRMFGVANGLRLVEGWLAVASAFILIVRSDDVIEMFINFAALEFVVNLDNVAFALAERGLVTDRLRDAARFVSGLGFAYPDDDNDGNGANRRTTKGNSGGSCADSAGRISHLKGSFLARLFGTPVRLAQRHPDGTRRTTLLLMTAVLFGCWAWILSGLDATDALPKSLDVEFFHANIPESTAAEANNEIKHFLISRSGTYVAAFAETEASFLGRLSNMVSGRTGPSLAYRKADVKAEAPLATARVALEFSRMPSRYDDVVFFDPSLRRWVFASCDPASSLRERTCAWPRVHSVETDEMDLTALSGAAFEIVEEDPHPYDASMTLPASIASTECARHGLGTSIETNELKCGLFGGVCSDPQEDLGFARQCICPPGQYGVSCTDQYGVTCPTLHIVRDDNVVEPPGAARFQAWEERRPFVLVKDERGVGNTPVWQRTVPSKGYTDRVEWRDGTHWIITRRQEELDEGRTYAIAEGASGGVANSAAMHVQPPPAGLTFRVPKMEAWGTRPDFFQPFAAYKLECKAAEETTA